ncbi:MAG TPA: hypothetical protein VHM93_20255 [Candidatus Acidoferrum sp.]|jgi:hypothetical protein|nr:hypothetical protein [Candidatus Acidoferrum sp.]
MWGRAIAVWLAVTAVEFVHGTLRWIFLRPRAGDFLWRQIAVFTGSVLFLVIVYVCEPWMALRSFADCLRVGLPWVVLTLAFEWNFGRYVVGRSWESIAAEYNLSHRGLMPAGQAIFAMTPWIRWRLLEASANHGRKTGLGDGLLLTFRRLAGKGRKSGVKPLDSRQSGEMLWHFGQG